MCDKASGALVARSHREKGRVELNEVENGFVITLGYGMQTKVASTNEEALVIVAEFLATLKPATN